MNGDTREARINAGAKPVLPVLKALSAARAADSARISRRRLKEAGVDYPLIRGGYKALRQTAIQVTIEQSQNRWCLSAAVPETVKRCW